MTEEPSISPQLANGRQRPGARQLASRGMLKGPARLLRRSLRTWLHPTLPQRPARPLSAETVRILECVVEALLEDFAPPQVYVETLVNAAQSEPGVAVVLEGFAARLDAAARRRHSQEFASCPRDQRRSLLPVPPDQESAWLRRQWKAGRDRLLRPQDALAYRHVVHPVLRQFADTDAWVAVGYTSHPGVPRDWPADGTAAGT